MSANTLENVCEKLLTHVHYGETLCGWQYRSKGEVKEVKNADHGVTGRVR